MELVARLDRWFADSLRDVPCRDDTRAYVVGVLTGFCGSAGDMSRESVVLAYADARRRGDFATFQRIGDWVLWIDAVHPSSIEDHLQVVESIGRMSYYACNHLVKQWPLYEELADDLPRIARVVRCKLGLPLVTIRHER